MGAVAAATLCAGGVHSHASSIRADGFSVEPGWKLHIGVTYADTMPFSSHEVQPVAAGVLASDRWSVESSCAETGRIITEWQPVKHLFVRLFMGQIRERCVVDVVALDASRCVVRFRAALASKKSIAGNRLMPKVAKEYEEGVLEWQRKVRRALIQQNREQSRES